MGGPRHNLGMSAAVDARGGFFHTSPRDVIDDLVNHVNLCAADALEALEHVLRDERLADAESIKLGVDQFQLKVQRTIDAKMDKFEEYALRNIFLVPDDLVVYDADERDGEQPAGAEPVAVLDADLVALAERVHSAIAARRALIAELRQLRQQAAAQQVYAPALAPLASLGSVEPGAHDGDVQLRTAVLALESGVCTLDQIREEVVSRLSHSALAGGADVPMQLAPAIQTGDLEDLARLSRTLRALG